MPNPQSQNSPAEIVGAAKTHYESNLRFLVETPENIGKLITIDTQTGDYEIGTDHIATVNTLRSRQPNAVTATLRIGYPTTYSRGIRMKPIVC
jgi:hypothetical protein